jgi:LytS/YehU family sensor histidine kinase
LTSSGRIIIENAIKEDLSFMKDFSNVEVSVEIVATDRLKVSIKVIQDDNSIKVRIVNFKKLSNGDFFISDFNDDFFL